MKIWMAKYSCAELSNISALGDGRHQLKNSILEHV